jgi:hypothetical protein
MVSYQKVYVATAVYVSSAATIKYSAQTFCLHACDRLLILIFRFGSVRRNWILCRHIAPTGKIHGLNNTIGLEIKIYYFGLLFKTFLSLNKRPNLCNLLRVVATVLNLYFASLAIYNINYYHYTHQIIFNSAVCDVNLLLASNKAGL